MPISRDSFCSQLDSVFMCDLLATLSPSCMQVGDAERVSGQWMRRFVDKNDLPVQLAVVGQIRTVCTVEEQFQLLVLGRPTDSDVLNEFYADQLRVLAALAAADTEDADRVIFNTQHWAHGAPESSSASLFVRVSRSTTFDSEHADVESEDSDTSFCEVDTDNSDIAHPPSTGDLVSCSVSLFRFDMSIAPTQSDAQAFTRAYGIQASHIVKLTELDGFSVS
ncbi:hypothetical protein R3P38DRAFT_3224889 [Favolaschia claudopus]|uniref:Uncharacterized protein n=1 Tax=Favolaschia claudopus TaxID=2862362 RepID=A0AAV9ZWW3_9AGAR